MYIKRDKKYYIYIYMLDVFSMIIAFFLAFLIRFMYESTNTIMYVNLFVFLIGVVVFVDTITTNIYDFFERSLFNEILAILRLWIYIVFVVFGYFFMYQIGTSYSRLFVVYFVSVGILLMFFMRNIFKHMITKRHLKSKNGTKMAIVTTSYNAPKIVSSINKLKRKDFAVVQLVIIDKNEIGREYGGYTVTACKDDFFAVCCQTVVDEVFVDIGYNKIFMDTIIKYFQEMGVGVHVNLNNFGLKFQKVSIEKLFDSTVLTFSNNVISYSKHFQKRLLDFIGSIIGIIITVIVSIFLIPAICIDSRGFPVYSQQRVGRNGRHFKIFKFRSMYKDADERKKYMMDKNKMQGLLFKIDDDPRITKVGKFIRRTSLDELPQFFNVFKGDMSLVGTRPPTVDEFEKYDFHHKSRLSFKPGITGMWQIMGRSNITDFEKIVELDNEYIENWSMWLDIKIIFKTIFIVLRGRGAV